MALKQNQNPWNRRLLKDLKRSYYVCPECDAMIPDSEIFLQHANEHPLRLLNLLQETFKTTIESLNNYL
jgi:hypothetical protein